MKVQIILLGSLLFLSSQNANAMANNDRPAEDDFKVGEKWIWKFKGVSSEGELRADGIDTREVVKREGVIGITIGDGFQPLTEITKPEVSDTPRYKWPLEVGKKWLFEESWTSQDGTKGKTSAQAIVVSYKEETVEGGTFMAYTIEYKGKITNSRGYSANVNEVHWYAPTVKQFIKLIQNQDDYSYTEELIEYTKP